MSTNPGFSCNAGSTPSGLFGVPSTTPASTTTTSSTTPGLLFGASSTPASTNAATGTVPGLSLGGGGSLSQGLSLGGGSTTAGNSPKLSFGAGPTTTQGLTLGSTSTPTASKTTEASTTSGTQPVLSNMSFADFNGILGRLTDEFEDLKRQFVEDVGFLNDFDKVLRDNHSKISAANDELSEIENDTSRCANESECISAQLKDIANLVSSLEKELKITDLDDPFGDASKNSDNKRQHIMQMYLATDAQMIQLEDDVEGLTQQVDAIVKVTGPDQTSATETFDDIRQILANQMDQLIYVDKQSEELNKRLNDIKVKL
jgi:predicted  nucleic acid-binding Zn-ribbon protein